MITPAEVIATVMGGGAVATWFWYDKKKSDQEFRDYKTDQNRKFDLVQEQLKKQNDIIVELKSTRITEAKSRQISEEVAQRIESQVSETKAMVSTMLSQLNTLASNLQTHTAVTKALEERAKSQP